MIVKRADEPVIRDDIFRLISEFGDDVSPGERGLLLYKGGTVCATEFSDYSANAICREMGYTKAIDWSSGYTEDYQDNFDITLEKVRCANDDWRSCSYSTTPRYCHHNYEHLFLTCAGKIFPIIELTYIIVLRQFYFLDSIIKSTKNFNFYGNRFTLGIKCTYILVRNVHEDNIRTFDQPNISYFVNLNEAANEHSRICQDNCNYLSSLASHEK